MNHLSKPILYTNLLQIPGFKELVLNEKENDVNNINNNTKILKLDKIEFEMDINKKYKIIRYDKNYLNYDLISTYGLCRSVIVNSDNNVVCFAPPKSIPSDIFMKKYDITKDDITKKIIAQEFVEGTMINVFWDDKIGLTGGWEISTRNTIGATSSFYKSSNPKETKTFRTMFLEACKENNLVLENLNKMYCYSFVLQHPENRIVVPFLHPQLYLVAVYSIVNMPISIQVYSDDIYEIKNMGWFETTTIKFPEIYLFETYDVLIEKYASNNTDYNCLGVVIFNKETGERTKIRNPVYEQVRSLRGNQPKLQYQYLCLRKEGKVGDFLKYYPENSKEFLKQRKLVHDFTNTLFQNYISCYIKKLKPLKEFSDQYKTHMFHIHEIYRNDLKEKNLYVTNSVVIKYVNELQTTLLMYCLNYHMRKRRVEIIKSTF